MEGFKSWLKKIKWDSILVSIFTVLIGVLCVAMPTESGNVLCIMFGCSLIVMGVVYLAKYFAFEILIAEHLLILSIIMIISGVFCLIYPGAIKSVLTILFGLYIVIDSLSSLSDSMFCARSHIAGWIFLMIISVLTLGLGIAVMFSSFETVIIFAGISLIIEGIKRFVITLTFSKKIKQAKKQLKENDIVINE